MSDQSNGQQQAWQPPAPQAAMPQPVMYAYPPQSKGKGWIVGLVAILAVFALIVIGMASCASAFSSLGGLTGAAGDGASGLTGDTIAIITLDGTIQYDGSTCSPEGLKAKLDEAENNSHIKAVVLRINSGGGTATAGEEMATYVKDFSKPIVVSSASINASAAYEISSQADYIYTERTTAIGSIGTAMTFTDLSGLYDKLGINMTDITSADSKDSTYGNRPLTDDEIAYYQDMIDQINEYFITTVAEGRNMSTDDVRALATGLTFTGMTAVQNGLADEIGTLQDACDKAAELAGASSSYGTIELKQASSSSSLSSLLDLFGLSVKGDQTTSQTEGQGSDGSFTQ